MKDFDIIIIGKTITGLALACGLSNNFKIAILDEQIDQLGVNNILGLIDTSIINLSSSRFLQYLKIWDSYIVDYIVPCYSIKFSDKDNLNHFLLKNSYLGYPCLGYVISNSLLHKALLYRAGKFKNICIMENIRLCRLVNTKNSVYVVGTDLQKLSANFVVVTNICQGSSLFQSLDISLVFRHCPYNIIVGTLISEYFHSNVIHYFFQKKNIIALFPLIESCSFFVFGLLNSSLFSYVSDDFNKKSCENLFRNTFNELGKISFQEDFRLIPCVSQYVRNFLIDRLLFLGSGSYDISPFKYHNINKYLMDVMLLLENISKYEDFFRQDINGDPFCLYSYERNSRNNEIKKFIKFEFIRSCFLGNSIVKKCLRNSMFQIMNDFSSVITRFNFVHNLMGHNSIPDWLLTEFFD